MTDGARTIIDVVIEDHRDVQELFQQIETTDDADDLRRLTEAVIATLGRYSDAEKRCLFPALRAYLPDGDAVTSYELAGHAEAEQAMNDLAAVDVTDPVFYAILSTLMQEIRHRLEDEQDDALPRLAEACSRQELVVLGRKYERARRKHSRRGTTAATSRRPASRPHDELAATS